MAFTKINAAGIGSTETVTLDGLTVINDGSFGGNVSVGGTLTYEDVTNIDSVGLITARNGIVVGSGITLSKDGDGFFTGVITATSYSGIDLSDVTGATGDFSIADKIVHTGDTDTALRFPAGDTISFETNGSERARIDSSGRVGVNQSSFATSDTMFSVSETTGHCEIGIISKNDSGVIINMGDTDSYNQGRIKYDNSDSSLTFRTVGTDRLRIDSSGRLLVGTTTEGHQNADNLTLEDSAAAGITLRSASNNSGGIFFSDGTSGDAEYIGILQYDHSSNYMRIYTNGSEKFRIDSSGRLLLGTTTEGQADADNLTIADSGSCGITLRSGTSAAGAIYFSDATSGAAEYDGAVIYNQSSQYMDFYTAQSQRVRITSDGKVGIGDASPDALLVIKGDSDSATTPSIRLKDGSDTRECWITNTAGDLMLVNGGDDNTPHCKITLLDGNIMTFATDNAERMRITSSGAVGINQNDPNKAKLHVVSASSGSDEIVAKFKGGSGADCLSKIGLVAGYSDTANDLEGHVFIGAKRNGSGNTAHLSFQTYDGSGVDERVRVSSSGKLRVGDALNQDAAGKFQVVEESGADQANDCNAYFETNAGDWNIKTYYNKNGAHYHIVFVEQGTERGDIRGNDGSNVTYNSGSDYRWKENIVRMTGTEGIEICKKLQPSKYNWIENREITGQINTVDGFIAHEVVEAGVLGAVTGEKDAVKEDGSIDGQMLDYGQMTPVLTAAIKGLIDKVETLEAKVAALEG